MELARMGMVGLHLIACGLGVGMILLNSLMTIRSLASGRHGHGHDARRMRRLRKGVATSLAVLWISGLALVGMEVLNQGHEVLLDPTVQAKFALALVITANAVVLRTLVLPVLQRAGSLLRMGLGRCVLSVCAGTVSAISWLYAALLGVGQALHWNLSLLETLAPYPVLIVGGTTGMLLLVAWAQARDASVWRGERVLT